KARNLAVFHARFRLELECSDDGAWMDLRDLPLHGKFAALLLELPGGVHQFTLVDLLFRLWRVGQRQPWQRERPQAARHLRRFGFGQRQWRRNRCAFFRDHRSSSRRIVLLCLRWLLDGGNTGDGRLLRVLRDHFLPLLLLAPILEPPAEKTTPPPAHAPPPLPS